jgi:hypothetical protein
MVLSSCTISSKIYKQTRPKVNSLLLYLSRYGQHVSSLDVRHPGRWKRVTLHALPQGLQLDSLCLENMGLQLQAGNSRQGLLQSLAALTQLQLLECCLLDADGLAGALQQLPQLQHLKVVNMRRKVNSTYLHELFTLNSDALQQLQGLTYLELEGCSCDVDLPPLEGSASAPQQQLSNLQSLRLREFKPSISKTEQLLAGMQHLTMLELQPIKSSMDPYAPFPPDVLTSMSQLQHLDLSNYVPVGCHQVDDTDAVSDFLYNLEQLTQLTHLRLQSTLPFTAAAAPAAYAALTASNKLQVLHLPGCNMSPGAWQHMLPAGKQLPKLQELHLNPGPSRGVFDMASLVSCCPNLQLLDLPHLDGSPWMVLAPLHNLTSLQRLAVPGGSMNDAGVKVLVQLTGLQELNMECSSGNGITADGMLPLTALKQLHSLRFTYTYATGSPPNAVSRWWQTHVSPGSTCEDHGPDNFLQKHQPVGQKPS